MDTQKSTLDAVSKTGLNKTGFFLRMIMFGAIGVFYLLYFTSPQPQITWAMASTHLVLLICNLLLFFQEKSTFFKVMDLFFVFAWGGLFLLNVAILTGYLKGDTIILGIGIA